ncbi:MAG: hypothetical protein EHM20_14830, partial [Alphaproteobacteria bacterium]
MQIILVNDFYSPHLVGGAESVIRSLALGFLKRGHSVSVITAHIQGTQLEEMVEGIRVYRIGDFPEIQKSICLASGTTAMKPIQKMINEYEKLLHYITPDVIHFHNVWLLGPDLVKVSGFRKGVTFHDYWPFCLRRSLMRVGEKPCLSPGKIPCRLCQLRAPATIEGLDIINTDQRQKDKLNALTNFNFYTAPSQFAAQQITHFSNLKVQVVHN